MADPNKKIIPLAHIYAQESYHDEAFVVGNREGLLALRRAIDRALVNGFGSSQAFVADGEGFDVCVIRHDVPWPSDQWFCLARPYTGDFAQERNAHAVWPAQLWPAAEALASKRGDQMAAAVSPLIEQLRNLVTQAESDDSLLEALDDDTRKALEQLFGQRRPHPDVSFEELLAD